MQCRLLPQPQLCVCRCNFSVHQLNIHIRKCPSCCLSLIVFGTLKTIARVALVILPIWRKQSESRKPKTVSPRKSVRIVPSLLSGEKNGPAIGKMFASAATAAAKLNTDYLLHPHPLTEFHSPPTPRHRYARRLRHSPLGFSHPKRTLPRKR